MGDISADNSTNPVGVIPAANSRGISLVRENELSVGAFPADTNNFNITHDSTTLQLSINEESNKDQESSGSVGISPANTSNNTNLNSTVGISPAKQQPHNHHLLDNVDFNILYTNSDSLLNKRDELQSILYEDRTDIVSITEVLPKNRCPSGYGSIEWNISGYIAYHPDITNYKGRGCIIYAKDTLELFQVNIGDSQLIEHVAVGINCQNGEKLLIICVYRSPSATDRECIRELSHILTKRCADNISFNYVLITGDFNFKEIDWGSQTTSTGEEHIATHFLEIVRDPYLIQHVKEATRHRGTDRPSTLDLVFTNEEGMIDGIDHCAPLGNSDHEILKFKFLFGATPTNKKTEKLCYFKGNYNAINNFLDEEDWDTDLMHGSVEEAWDRFADKLSIVTKENVPVRKSSTRNFNTPWMDQDTLNAVKTKRKLWHQHGFRKGYSCVTQLIEVLEQWTEELDNHNCIDTIYLDFQKAFDTVPHQRLLNKLRGYGIKGPLLNWLENFLIGRKQRVVLNGEESEWTEVTSGIPQGSVLGPILFIIYINDLPDTVKSMVKLLADDTKIYSVVNNEEDQECLQSDINNLMAWSQKWMLTFNKKKCKYMHLGHEPGNTYKMEGEEITRSSEEKDLGINIDDKLKFQSHISIQVKKANQKLGLIRRSFTYMDTEMFLTLFKSLVRPHLEYGSNFWAVIYKKEAISLENVQRRATRLIPELRHLNYSDRLRKLGLPSLQYRRIRSDIVETYIFYEQHRQGRQRHSLSAKYIQHPWPQTQNLQETLPHEHKKIQFFTTSSRPLE